MRLALLLFLAACGSRERSPATTGTPLGMSTARGPATPLYAPIDAGNEVLARSISPGVLAAPGRQAAPAPAATPAPAAVASDAQLNVESPPPPPED